MPPTVLVLIKTDPMKSHRAVEGLRIALGLVSGEHPVSIVLLDRAALLLSEDADDLVDGDILPKYLPVFKELDQTFFVEEKAFKASALEESDYSIEPVSMERISKLIAQAGRFLVF